jgi:FlaG/FlaF family flagellin (archaellin)
MNITTVNILQARKLSIVNISYMNFIHNKYSSGININCNKYSSDMNMNYNKHHAEYEGNVLFDTSITMNAGNITIIV